MKKVFKMEELDCANCAARMEEAISRIDGVRSARVNFMTQKLTLEADDASFDAALREAQKVCRRVDANCRIIV